MRKMHKKGLNISAVITGIVLLIVAIIVSFLIVGNTAGDITNAADNISGSGLPLASLFSSSGVVLLVFMAGLLIALITISLSLGKLTKQ